LGDIAGYFAPVLPSEGGVLKQIISPHGLWLVIIVIVVGGLVSGAIVYTFAPEAEGHGTDTAVKAFHQSGGKIRKRVTPIKIITSAITIGTGGAAGREGPTALFSAGIGSIYSTIFKRSDRDRRLLVLIGMASGLSAIFRSPIGTAVFATEVLYSDMDIEASALIFTLLGSIIAYAVNGVFVGWEPLFQVPSNIGVNDITDYAWYGVLGLSSGIVGTIVPNAFYGLRDLFKKINIPAHFKPAVGALGVGLIALAFPQVLGGGYGWIQLAINGQIVIGTLIVLMFAKLAAFALTVSSGGSGGVFAPTLFVGAMLGGCLAIIFHQSSAAFAVVGMAAVFGSAARVPVATLLMVTEMTGGYKLLVPAGLAVSLAFIVQDFLSLKFKYRSLYEAQVKRRADSPAHRAEHLKKAINILAERKSINPEIIGSLDIVSLLRSNINLKMPDGNQLYFARINKKSPCIGTRIKENCGVEKNDQFEIAAIIRDESLIFPDPNTSLEEDDQLLIFGKQDKFEEIRKRLS
jgi:chloride channel protein, CIC family